MVLEEPRSRRSALDADLRRSARFPLSIPLQIKWQTAESAIFQEDSEAVEVNAHGAILRIKSIPPVGTILQLTNTVSQESIQARVVAIRRTKPETIAVELLVPSEAFWGITFKLKRASNELLRLEQEIRSGVTEPRVLQEFRDAVDYIRKTAWAVNEWQERHFKHKDTSTVLSLLTSERIRRATQLSDAITSEVDARQLTLESPGVTDLLNAMERVKQTFSKTRMEGSKRLT